VNGEFHSNCLACGVCCHSQLESYVRVSGDDWARFGDEAERVAHFIGHRAYLKMQHGHCAALELQKDDEGRPVYFCTIYERRPQICRALDRGSPQCEAERALKGERVVEQMSC
jgi:Fe-S-cluster containining protein